MKKSYIFIAFLLLLLSLQVRLWHLNEAGRVWDEQSILEKGYTIDQLLMRGDVTNSYWYTYAADHPIFPFYFIGAASYGDLIKFDPNGISATERLRGAPVFHYDMTYGRMVSVIVSSLAVVLVFFIGLRFFSPFTGVIGSVILALLPHFLAYSQMVELESWVVLFFTAAVFTFLLYLDTGKLRYLLFTAILTGINLDIKQPNALLFVFYFFCLYAWKGKKAIKIVNFRYLFLFISLFFISLFIFYPMPWFHISTYISYAFGQWQGNGGLIPELIFGKIMGAHVFYYMLAFLITTPVIILILTFLGLQISYSMRKKKIYVYMIIWFMVPFLMSLFHIRQHMIRYIIMIYAPTALISAYALEWIFVTYVKKNMYKYVLLIMLFIYLCYSFMHVSPLYLTYYNELVGGTDNVYEHNLFFLGWWGEGLKQPGVYIAKHAKPNDLIGLALDPNNTLYKVSTLRYEDYRTTDNYAFVVVNTFDVQRVNFNESELKNKYKIVYVEKIGNADIAHVYIHK